MKTSVIGYPRIGKDRELKFASEKFFAGGIDEAALQAEKKICSNRRKQGSLISLPTISPSTITYLIRHSSST